MTHDRQILLLLFNFFYGHIHTNQVQLGMYQIYNSFHSTFYIKTSELCLDESTDGIPKYISEDVGFENFY